jgi:phospholipid/cholesterol/gamma-HCH transport system substrate-binding protein
MGFSREAKVGLFVLIAILVLAYLSFQVEKIPVLKRGEQRVRVEFDTVEGLEQKAAVRMAGVRVGEVESIKLVKDKVLVTLRLDRGVVVRRNYRVAVSSLGLLGEKYVEITPRESWEAKPSGQVEPGEEIITEKSPPMKGETPVSMERMMLQINSVAEDIKAVTSALKGTLATPEGQQQIKNILTNLEQLTANLSATTGGKKDQIGGVIDNFYKFSKDLNEIMSNNKESLNDAFSKTGEIAENLRVITASLKSALEKPEDLQQSIRNIKEATAKLEKIMDSASRITERVEKGEGTIGKLFADDEAYENLVDSLKGIKKLVGAADNFKLSVGYRGEYMILDRALKSYVSIKLQPKEDKYFQFDIVDDPAGEVHWKQTKRVSKVDGVRHTKIEFEETRSDKLKFSAFVAKRFWDLTLRGGLVENSGGVGADYHLWKDRIRLSVDAWDFGRREDFPTNGLKWNSGRNDDKRKTIPRIKAGATWNINENIFIAAGGNDLANERRITPFVSAGIIFTDEDLKWLFGRISLPTK